MVGRFDNFAFVQDNGRELFFTPKTKAPQPLWLRQEYFNEYSGRQNASVRTCGKQRSGGRKAPLEQLNCNAYPVGFPVKALPRQRCLQPLLERLQDIGFEKAASTSPEWCFPYPGQLLENAP